MSLSSLIVQREIASIREIEEALARQVLYGGDFVTNLLEVSSVEESTLMPLVAESFGLSAAPPGELPRAPVQATRLVAADVASERSIAPLEVGQSLVLAVAEPLTADAAQELSFALALPIVQRIAPLFRIRQAIARDYGVPLDKRTARLITKVVSHEPGVASTYPPPFDPSPIYRTPPRPPSLAPPPPAKQALDLKQTLNTVQGTLVRNTVVPPPRAARRRRGPLTGDIAKAELDAAVDRDVVFDLLFEFARQFFDYTAVFIVQGELAEGRDSFGDGASREKVARIRVPFFAPNILGAAYNTKAFVRQKPASDGIDRILLTDLGREGTTECVVFPIIVRKRVVALLFGDGGGSGIDLEGVGQVNELIGSAAGAFERVIMRKKLKGTDDANAGAGPHGRKKSERLIPAVSQPGPPRHSERPTSEEQPVEAILRESMRRGPALPADLAPPTLHDPLAAAGAFDNIDPSRARSDNPPPTNLLAVRRPSGRPIPREEPAAASAASAEPPKTKAERRTKSQAFKRAEAPRLDFGVPSTPNVVTEEITAPPRHRSPLAQTLVSQTREFTPAGEMPVKANEPAPSRTAPPTDLSPQPIFVPSSALRPPEVRPQGVVPTITLDDNEEDTKPILMTRLANNATLTSGLPILEPPVDANPSPVTPLIVVTPENEIEPIPLETLKHEEPTPRSPAVTPSEGPDSPAQGPEPVLALSTRKGFPAPPPPSSSRSMPASEQQVSVAAHKPPSSQRSDKPQALPSVIVDVAGEFTAMVDRVLDAGDEEAEATLTRAGAIAMPAIMARFPGPIVVEAERLERGPLPRVAECGPVIRLIASQRRTALPFVLALVEAGDVETRFWGTYLLTELVYTEAIEPVLARIFDEDEKVRRAARAAARAQAEATPQAIIERLAEVANTQSLTRRLQAIEALAETREPTAAAALMPLLEESNAEVVSATRTALVVLTQQDFGLETDRWLAWWKDNRTRHRLEWLIDALNHDQRALRASASDELRSITKEYFGYYDDLPKRERERAQARYREWWDSIGRVRFSRASNRGV